MHRNICSRSIASIVVPFLLMPLATSTVVAVVSLGGVGEANSMDRTIFPEETPDRIVSDQEMPLDALGYLGGLFEARFYQPHSTTDDPREEIREAASLYGLDLAMMMSIAKVESDFDPRVRTGSYKGLFQLSDYEFKKYGDGSIWDARDNARAAAHMFLVQAEATLRITPRDTWCTSRVSKAPLNTTHTPSVLRGSPCVQPTRAC
jgi:hypothetical protein